MFDRFDPRDVPDTMEMNNSDFTSNQAILQAIISLQQDTISNTLTVE
jgi:hypothetical protein